MQQKKENEQKAEAYNLVMGIIWASSIKLFHRYVSYPYFKSSRSFANSQENFMKRLTGHKWKHRDWDSINIYNLFRDLQVRIDFID